MPALLALLLAACGPPCAEVSTDCDPLYAPTFDEIHARTLSASCALSGCHAGASPAAGMDLSEIETAYDALLAEHVDPESVGCSTLIARIDAEAAGHVMPPGGRLPEAERCAIRQWVEAGAPR